MLMAKFITSITVKSHKGNDIYNNSDNRDKNFTYHNDVENGEDCYDNDYEEYVDNDNTKSINDNHKYNKK